MSSPRSDRSTSATPDREETPDRPSTSRRRVRSGGQRKRQPSAPEPEDTNRDLPLLSMPSGGVPEVVSTDADLQRAADELSNTTGPVALDAERASGYRYGQRAFLVQIRRGDGPIYLIDPTQFSDLSIIQDVIGNCEWILHAASQDLPCLSEIGLNPQGSLFDTELGARLCGYPRVGLGSVVEQLLGVRLAKEHSAVDWSTRPLPHDWIIYAALDVEVLAQIRDLMELDLERQNKQDIAEQEFTAVRQAKPPAPRKEPWRKTSGLHTIKNRRHLAVLRELWHQRDEAAQQRDISPGRVLPDRALVTAASSPPSTIDELKKLPIFSGKTQSGMATIWFEAITRGLAVPDSDLPDLKVPTGAPPPARVWPDRNPDAAARLAAARALAARHAEELNMPVENVMQPSVIRKICWSPPQPLTVDEINHVLKDSGARPWQIERMSNLIDCLTLSATPQEG